MAAQRYEVLVVDDDPAWQQILTEILVDMGRKVDVAANYASAEVLLRTRPYRLAVVDLSLGEYDHLNRDGLRILEAASKHNPNCATILVSGFATVEIAVQAMKDFGAITCLRKEEFKRSAFREAANEALTTAPVAPLPIDTRLASENKSERTGAPVMPAQAAVSEYALLLEDDAGWRELLSELLVEEGFEVHSCRSYVEAVGLMKRGKYQVAVVDLALASSVNPVDNLDGLRMLELTQQAEIPTVVVSGHASPERIEMVYETYEIFTCLEKQAFDRKQFRMIIDDIRKEIAARNVLSALSNREVEVLELLVKGMTNKEIADTLFVTHNTIKRHLKSIFTKLDVNTRAAAVSKAMHSGMS